MIRKYNNYVVAFCPIYIYIFLNFVIFSIASLVVFIYFYHENLVILAYATHKILFYCENCM